MSGTIAVRRAGAAAWFVLDHPAHRNALTLTMWEQLKAALDQVQADASIHVVIVRGAGTQAFSAGADIGEFDRVRRGVDAIRRYDDAVHAAVRALHQLTAISLAQIWGDAVGGGAELALAADLRFAGQSLRMGITPARLGIVYGPKETAQLMDHVGTAAALDLLVSGRLVRAEEALRLRLVDRVVPDADLDPLVDRYIAQLTDNSWEAVHRMKQMVRALANGISPSDPRLDNLVYEAYDTSDYAERVAKFVARRPGLPGPARQ